MDSAHLTPLNGSSLREVHASLPPDFRPGVLPGYVALPAHDSPLHEYLRILIKRKWVVLSSLLLVVGVVALSTLRSTPIYDAVGSIAINKWDPVVLNLKD